MSGVAAFAQELMELGYKVDQREPFVIIDYEVDVGSHAGEVVRIGLEVSAHPHSPPTGPFVSPRLLPIRPDGSPAPYGGVHEAQGRSGFDDPAGQWQYWSRPFNEWPNYGRTARAYLEVHLRRLFAGLPATEAESCAA